LGGGGVPKEKKISDINPWERRPKRKIEEGSGSLKRKLPILQDN